MIGNEGIRSVTTVNKIDWDRVLYSPQEIHKEYISGVRDSYGEDVIEEFSSVYKLVKESLAWHFNYGQEHERKALIMLIDGLSTLICILNVSFLGFALEGAVLIRYYIECLALAFGIFNNPELFSDWQKNPKKKYANRFSKQGLQTLEQKYSGLEGMWKVNSEISHLTFHSTGSSFFRADTFSIGGCHDGDTHDKMIKVNIRSVEILLKITKKILNNEFKPM